MWKMSWPQHIRNTEMLRRIKKEEEIVNIENRRKMSYFGNISKNEKYELMRLFIQGKVEGKKGLERRRTSWP